MSLGAASPFIRIGNQAALNPSNEFLLALVKGGGCLPPPNHTGSVPPQLLVRLHSEATSDASSVGLGVHADL